MNGWVRWRGGELPFPPETLVHVKFYGPPELCDQDMPPLPASWWGNSWTTSYGRIDEYKIAKDDTDD